MFENSREFYIQQDWNPAIEGFQECLNLLPEDAALRCIWIGPDPLHPQSSGKLDESINILKK